MSFRFQTARLVPQALIVEQIVDEGYELVVTAHAHALAAACPLCGQESRRIHSRYLRQLADLPCAGRKVRLHIVARRFVCRAPQCPGGFSPNGSDKTF